MSDAPLVDSLFTPQGSRVFPSLTSDLPPHLPYLALSSPSHFRCPEVMEEMKASDWTPAPHPSSPRACEPTAVVLRFVSPETSEPSPSTYALAPSLSPSQGLTLGSFPAVSLPGLLSVAFEETTSCLHLFLLFPLLLHLCSLSQPNHSDLRARAASACPPLSRPPAHFNLVSVPIP